MASLWGQPSLEFQVKVVRAAGLEPADQRRQLEGGTFFVRYYVPAGDGRRRLRVDTREVPCGSGDASWGELARFERWGRGAAGAPGGVGHGGAGYEPAAPGGGLAFELRWRPRAPPGGLAALLGTSRPSSRVLARAELAWRDVASSSQAPAERWLTLSPEGRGLGWGKAPRLLVEVRIVRAAASDDVTGRRPGGGGVDECCRGGEWCGECGWVGSEEDIFLAATFSQHQ
ncbi:hypothetical protein ACP70R_011556 [Stipagrostis hirtigluma subsp. patula]